MHNLLRIACVGLIGGCQSVSIAATASVAAIFQPGAPGQPSRQITAAESVALAKTVISPADVKFMQDMIMHHAQAVEMVELLQTRTERDNMRTLGKRISMSQTDEIALMRTWLARRGQSDVAEHAGHMHMTMAGMLTPQQMAALAAAQGPEFDRLFLSGMIQHHQGAVRMVKDLLATPGAGEDVTLFDFLTNVVADQTAEISRMNELLQTF
jgi:uncharacterized protein (DUF305 family)